LPEGSLHYQKKAGLKIPVMAGGTLVRGCILLIGRGHKKIPAIISRDFYETAFYYC
jgi:hypothetical protein